MASTYVSVTQGRGLNGSTFTAGTLVITNDAASGQKIESVTFDISSSLLPGMVFDPEGTAGDIVAKDLEPNSGALATGFSGHSYDDPLDPTDADGSEDGWLTLKVNFSDFDPGETFTFSVDVDPASIKGTEDPGPQRSGSVSGLELVGSAIIVEYEGGSIATNELFIIPGDVGGSQVVVTTEPMPPEPTVSVVGIGAGPATVGTAAQQVTVTGPAGAAVRLLVVEGGAFTEDTVHPDALPLGPFDANSAVKVTEYSGTIGSGGTATIDIQLTKTAVQFEAGESGDTGLNYITAALIDASGQVGPAATPVILEYDPTQVPPPDGVVAAINAGGGTFTAADGTVYSADSFFAGGRTFSTTDPIANTQDDPLYQSERFESSFSYDIPVGPGDYDVTLQFAEIFFTSTGQRLFDVQIEGVERLSNVDLFALAGHDTAHDVTIPVTVGADGVLDIDFVADVNRAKISAIKVAVADGSEPPPTQAPTDLDVNPKVFDEETPYSGTLTATDPDSTTFTFSIVDDPSGLFAIQNNNQLVLTELVDFENLPDGFTQQNGTATVDLTLQVQDESGNTYSEVVTLTVNDVDEGSPGEPVTLAASAGALNGTSGPQQWSAAVTISALAANGNAAVITHSADGFGIQGGRFNTQLDHIATNNTSEQFILEFNSAVRDVVLQFGLMNANEKQGNRETGTWTAFDASGAQVASGVIDPANGSQIGSLTYDIPISTAQPFTKLVMKATGYNGGTTGISGDSSDFALKQLTYTPADGSPPPTQAPTDLDVNPKVFDEEAAYTGTLTATDPDSTTFTFSIVDDPSGLFAIQNTNQLVLTQLVDFENLPDGFTQQNGTATIDLTLQVADESGNTYSEVVTLTVNDVDEGSPGEPVTLAASAGALNGTSGPQQWSAAVTISALAANGNAAVITHSADGFGIQGGRFNTQLDHIATNNTSEQFVLEFDSAVRDVVLQFGLMNANEKQGNRETGTWTAFDASGAQVASGLIDPANGTQVGNLTYNIPISTAQSFTKLVMKATGYNGGTTGISGDSSDFALKQLTYTPADGSPPPTGEVVAAINAGGGAFTAADGIVYSADSSFSGGNTFTTTDPIANTQDDALYQSERFGSSFSYDIPVGPGDYHVTLQFAEIFHTSAGQRVFDVKVEGVERLSNVDLFALAGHDTAHDVTLPVTVGADGILDVDFTADVNNAKISAIKVALADGSEPPPPPPPPVSFELATLAGENAVLPSSLQFGPDGKLYVADLKGKIHIYDVAATSSGGYQVTSTQTINSIQQIPNHNDDGSLNTNVGERQITGLVVTGTATNPVIYVGSSDPRWGGGSSAGDVNLDTNSGIISRLTKVGNSWEKLDLVRGLPRSEENHSTNGLQYDASTNTLLVAQGGHTNAGAPSQKFAYLNEYALSAAVLAIDLDAIGNSTYDIPTIGGTATPFGGNDGLNMGMLVAGGPVQIFSPGFRNMYDLVITESGRMYGIDNGPNPTWGGWPHNEGTDGTVTNQYDSSEPGGNQVNNKDGLHLISEGYYGGHPTPLRANPQGAGLYTDNDQGLAVWRQQGGSGQHDLPANWLPVDPSLQNTIEGDFQMPGVEDGSLTSWQTLSVNGIDEYTSLAFGGQMKGDLIAAALKNHTLYRVKLNDDGTQVQNVTTLASNFANQPLDVTAQGDGGPFPGTVWVTSLDGKITVLTPTAGSGTEGDSDGDGYSDADEIANGSDPFNPASIPPDFDGDFVSDLNDLDDDSDGLLDVDDHFARDAANGTTTVITSTEGLFYPMFGTDPGVGMFGLGFTGLMNNGTTDYLNQYSDDNLVPGGATGTFTIVNTTSGDPIRSTNTQDNGFQFGVKLDPSVAAATVTARVVNPFKNQTPDDWQSVGIQIGTGDQDNYLKIAVSALKGPGGIQVLYEEAGAVVTAQNFAASDIVTSNTVDLFLLVDPGAGTVTPSWEYTTGDGQTLFGTGDPIAVSGNVLAAIQGTYQNQGVPSGLAVGVINTHFNASAPIEASYDHIAVYAEPEASTTMALASGGEETLQVSSMETTTESEEPSVLSTADVLVPQQDGGYDDIDFEFFADRTNPGTLPGKPAAIVFKGDDPLRFDTTDTLLFHDNRFETLRDLDPGAVADIAAGRARGVLDGVFDRVPANGPPDIFVFGESESTPGIGRPPGTPGGPPGTPGGPPGNPGQGQGGQQNGNVETANASDDFRGTGTDLSMLLAQPEPAAEAVFA